MSKSVCQLALSRFVCSCGVAFCIIRIATVALRISSTIFSDNIRIALAAQILLDTATIILYLVNSICATRILRAQHPALSRSFLFKLACVFLFLIAIFADVLIVVAGVLAAYDTRLTTLRIAGGLESCATTILVIIAGLPIPVILLSHITRPSSDIKSQYLFTKNHTITVILVSILLTFRAGWICAATFQRPAPLDEPLRWYLSKTVFYLVGLLVEVTAVYLLALGPIDRDFYLGRNDKFESLDPAPMTTGEDTTAIDPAPTHELEKEELKPNVVVGAFDNPYWHVSSTDELRSHRNVSSGFSRSHVLDDEQSYVGSDAYQNGSRGSLVYNNLAQGHARPRTSAHASRTSGSTPGVLPIDSSLKEGEQRIMAERNIITMDQDRGYSDSHLGREPSAVTVKSGLVRKAGSSDIRHAMCFGPGIDPETWTGDVNRNRASLMVVKPHDMFPFTSVAFQTIPTPQPMHGHISSLTVPARSFEPVRGQTPAHWGQSLDGSRLKEEQRVWLPADGTTTSDHVSIPPQFMAPIPRRPMSMTPIPVTAPLGSNPHANSRPLRPASTSFLRRSQSASIPKPILETLAEDDTKEPFTLTKRVSNYSLPSRPQPQHAGRSNYEVIRRRSSVHSSPSFLPYMSGLSFLSAMENNGHHREPDWRTGTEGEEVDTVDYPGLGETQCT